jgi:hypothetical protein
MSDSGEEQARRDAARRILRAQRQRETAPTPQAARGPTVRRSGGALFGVARACVALAVALVTLAVGLVVLGGR